jgi:hypothetical protein
MSASFPNPYQLPEALLPVFHRFISVEHATMTAKGQPLTYPVSPYVAPDGCSLDVSTGLAYPAKAERARRNPKTALLYSYPVGSGLEKPPTVLVYGHAAVRDHDLQANTDRYVRELTARGMMPPFPKPLVKRLHWYLVRIWIETTPVRILWWPEGDLDRQPERWDAPAGWPLPASDPAPVGNVPPRWKDAPNDWRKRAAYAVEQLGQPVLTVVDANGYPVPFRVRRAVSTAAGFQLELYRGSPAPAQGAACLTFHSHPEKFTGQENMVFVGQVSSNGETASFAVDHCPGDWSLPPKGLAVVPAFFGNGWKLRHRISAEVERRGQALPVITV